MPINPSLLGQPRLPTCAGKHQHFIDHKYFVDIKINKWLYKTYNGERWDLDYQNKCRGSVQRSKQHLGQRESWVSVGNVDKPEGFFFFFLEKWNWEDCCTVKRCVHVVLGEVPIRRMCWSSESQPRTKASLKQRRANCSFCCGEYPQPKTTPSRRDKSGLLYSEIKLFQRFFFYFFL